MHVALAVAVLGTLKGPMLSDVCAVFYCYPHRQRCPFVYLSYGSPERTLIMFMRNVRDWLRVSSRCQTRRI